jgi:polysaccharide biosynthesis protein PelA
LGFYSARITDLGSERWRVEDRGTLGTLRFDRAIDREVDFSRSVGVLGQTHHQGSLYVALDPAEASPVIALAAADRTDEPPDAPRAYLIESRWPIEGLELDGRAFSFRARGFGPGEMVWKVPEPGRYQIVAEHGDRVVESFAEVGADGLLAFVLRMRTDAVVSVAVRRIRGS